MADRRGVMSFDRDGTSVVVALPCWCHPSVLKTASCLQISQVSRSKSGVGLLAGRATPEETEAALERVCELRYRSKKREFDTWDDPGLAPWL